MDAKDYRPIYDTTVTEKYLDPMQPGGWSTRDPAPINAQYCLMLTSALLMSQLFSGTPVGVPAIYLSQPMKQAPGSHYESAFNHNVPWLRFTVDGQPVERNAGLLAMYWDVWNPIDHTQHPMPGVAYWDSLNQAVIDVQTTVEGQG